MFFSATSGHDLDKQQDCEVNDFVEAHISKPSVAMGSCVVWFLLTRQVDKLYQVLDYFETI